MSENKHPFNAISELIDTFNNERNSMTTEELQNLRELISYNLFLLSDSAALAISKYEAKDYERKSLQAERIEYYRNSIDDRTGKNYTISDAERLARLELKDIEKEVVEALRQKERVKIIIIAVQQILNSLSSRISQINK